MMFSHLLKIIISTSWIFAVFLPPTIHAQLFIKTSAPANLPWSAITSDSSGRYLAAATSTFTGTHKGGNIYTSSNYGETWVGSIGAYWSCIKSDSTGQYLAAGVTGDPDNNYQVYGGIFTSANYGASWVETSAPFADYASITSDSTGKYLAAASKRGGIYTSADYGGNWTQTLAPTGGWISIASDSSGKFLAATSNQQFIYTSSNYGVTWKQISTLSGAMGCIASDGTGKYLAVVVNNFIYTSSNYGDNWFQTSAPSLVWGALTSGSTGQYLACAVAGDGIYSSSNYGVSWTKTSAGPYYWDSMATDFTGQFLAAAVYGSRFGNGGAGGIYLQVSSPTSQPSTQPTMKPNHPSSQPSSRPSCTPSAQPTSNPTLKAHTIIKANGLSTIDSNGYVTATTVIDNIGNTQELYLTVKFLQTGFDSSSFTVDIIINGNTKSSCSDCTVDGVCGDNYVVCCYNQDITSDLVPAVGGQLSIVAQSTGPYRSPLCGSEPHFQVDYTIAKGAASPTPLPTNKPTDKSAETIIQQSSSGVSLITTIESIFIPAASVLFLSGMVIVGTAIHYGRKQESNVEPLSLMKCMSTFVMFGGSFLSQIFSLLVFFNEDYAPGFGDAWVSCRALFVVVGSLFVAWLFSKQSGYQEQLDWLFLAKNKKLYGFVVVFMAFNPNFVSVLPWKKTQVTSMTMGFPSLQLCYLTIFLSVTESLVLTSINAAFAVEQNHIFQQSALQQFEFIFSLSFTCVNGIVALIECLFLLQVDDGKKQKHHFSFSMHESTELVVASDNPLHHKDSVDLGGVTIKVQEGDQSSAVELKKQKELEKLQLYEQMKSMQESLNKLMEKANGLEL